MSNRNFDNCWAGILIWSFVTLWILAWVGISNRNAYSHEHAQYYAEPEDVKRWLDTLMQPDNPGQRCCGESDAYWADSFKIKGDQYVAVITDPRVRCVEDIPGQPEDCVPYRPNIPEGTEVIVPNHKLKIDKGNPTGHGVIFLSTSLDVLCYVVPGGV